MVHIEKFHVDPSQVNVNIRNAMVLSVKLLMDKYGVQANRHIKGSKMKTKSNKSDYGIKYSDKDRHRFAYSLRQPNQIHQGNVNRLKEWIKIAIFFSS